MRVCQRVRERRSRISQLPVLGLCIALAAGLAADSASAQTASITAADLDYGISGRQINSFNFDFTSDPTWTAGSQRSANGSADSGNQRAGRVFVDFQLTPAMISTANSALAIPGSTISLTFAVNSIGQGVTGVPYTDGLDLRYLGVSSTDRDANTLWNTPGVGADQSDILAVASSIGSKTVTLTNTSLLSQIASASAGQYVSFGMSNSAGIDLGQPVGNSTAETYGFQMSQSLSSYALSINAAVPEPTAIVLWSLLGAMIGGVAIVRGRRNWSAARAN